MALWLWNTLQTVLRLTLLGLFAATCLGMMVVAWWGLSAAFRPEVALGVLFLSGVFRVNVFVVVGSYFFGDAVLRVPEPQALIFIVPALGLIFPAPLKDIFVGLWQSRA